MAEGLVDVSTSDGQEDARKKQIRTRSGNKEHRPHRSYGSRDGDWHGRRHDHQKYHRGGWGYYEHEQRCYYGDIENKRENSHKRPHHKESGRGRHKIHQTKSEDNDKKLPTMNTNTLPGQDVPTSEEKPSLIEPEKDPSSKSLEVAKKAHSEGHKRRGKKIVSTPQSDELSQQLLAGTLECMVCCDYIKRRQEVWSCSHCYHIFHLRCIQRWARSPAAAVSEEVPESGWRCPSCRGTSTVIPSVYKCFCGRLTNPAQHKCRGDLTLSHSCGEVCLRRLSNDSSCYHKCRQPCHPGPCPPCPATVTRRCPCGKKSTRVRCSQPATMPSCGSKCGKALACGEHRCQWTCHEGDCEDCAVELRLSCHCGREEKTFLCGELLEGDSRNGYCCGKICNRVLGCGNHTCEERCHSGECPPCSLLPSSVATCPCGALPIDQLLPDGTTRVSCLDEVPTCNNICSKPLPCSSYNNEVHKCSSYCHIGACPPCTLTSEVVCRCGRSTNKVPCLESKERAGFVCNKPCGKKLSCGRHKCQEKCCVNEGVHVCVRVCGRKFDCGEHTCPDVCHPGRCGPCWNISYEELTCHCGGEKMLPPIPCGSRPPTCTRPCARMHSCDHPVAHTCHSEEACPPCTYFTEKLCMGGHTLRKLVPCHMTDVSCGKPCNKPLPCGMHTCRRTCHKGTCQRDGEVCRQPCTTERKYCSHPCNAPCHPGDSCPDTPCKIKVLLKCRCGLRSEPVLCLASSKGVMNQAFQKVHSQGLDNMMRELQSGQSVKIETISLKNLQEKQLECNEECAQWERNRKLAEALEIPDADYSPNVAPDYSAFLQEQARENPQLVTSYENPIRDSVERALQTGQPVTHTFKPAKRDHRRIIHELAEFYRCSSVSYDQEPHRNVVITATKKSSVPAVSLSQYCASGSRGRPMPPPVRLAPERQKSPVSSSTTTDYFNDDLVNNT